MAGAARYDGLAEWFDREFAASEIALSGREIVLRLLGRGEGRLLDAGCGGGAHAAALAGLGWRITGIDASRDQVRLARSRGVDAILGRAEELPFEQSSFDAAVSMWTHTDVDDFPAVVRELARVLRPGGALVYIGVHPCFVGPHSRFHRAEGVPELHAGYWEEGRYNDGLAVSAEGLRARVGAAHVPLGHFLGAFLTAGFVLERFEEPREPAREYPFRLALRWRR